MWKDRAGAVLLGMLALGLGLIAADLMFGGKVFTRGCCADDVDQPAADADVS